LAQTGSEPFDIGGGYSVTLPERWTRVGNVNNGFAFVSDKAYILLYGPEAMQDLTRPGTRGGPRSAMSAAYQSLYDEQMDAEGIESREIAGREAAVWNYLLGSAKEGIFAVIALDEPLTFMAIDISTPLDELSADAEEIVAIVESLTVAGAAAGSTSSSAAEPCVVSAETANSAHLRVGPGFNRTSVAFLPAGQNFEVIGQATADDDSVWFKLDKAEAAPQSAANEVWVLNEEVEASDGCAAVQTVGGSPVIPIINAPAAPPETQSGDGGGDTGAATNASAAPLGGTWTVTFARQSNASCAGYQNVVLPTTDVWEDWRESDYVWTATLIPNGTTSFTFDGDVYQASGGNEYVGNWEFGGGVNTYLYWRVISPTSMSGTMTGNITTPDGLACSGTTAFSATRR
ncbi:MAG: hypothetical protein KC547_21410, partial [Anaerolineae bacterium]|nr:hypothetical protein [Anaerolineae bacterium]